MQNRFIQLNPAGCEHEKTEFTEFSSPVFFFEKIENVNQNDKENRNDCKKNDMFGIWKLIHQQLNV